MEKETEQENKNAYEAPDFILIDLKDSIGTIGGSGVGGGRDNAE